MPWWSEARIQFHEGLNLLTGETGSGKSLVVDSLGLLLGARASGEMVRTGADKARISGIFRFAMTPELAALPLKRPASSIDDEDVIVEREISSSGKAAAFVANRPVTTAFAAAACPGPRRHSRPERAAIVVQFAAAARAARSICLKRDRCGIASLPYTGNGARSRRKLDDLLRNEQEKLRLVDMWRFQIREIESAQIKPAEDEVLESEKRVLQNTTRLQENASTAFDLLYESEQSAINFVRRALKRIDELARIDASLNSVSSGLKQAEIAVEESAWTLRDYLDKLEADPRRLEDIGEPP